MKTKVEMNTPSIPVVTTFGQLAIGDWFGDPDRGNYVYIKTNTSSWFHPQDGKSENNQGASMQVIRANKVEIITHWGGDSEYHA